MSIHKDKHKHKVIINREKPINKVILFTNARDEKNIKEWAAHHILIGFSLVYIFDHKSKIPLKKIFQHFDKRVMVERCELNIAPKLPLMRRAKQIASSLQADWFIYLDADEFIYIHDQYRGIKHLLYHYRFSDLLGINWLLFGSNYHIRDPDGLIIEKYTKSSKTIDKHVKTFVRPSQVMDVNNPHFYKIIHPDRMFSINKQNINIHTAFFHEWNIAFHACPVFIAHYIYQSEETYVNRKILLPADDTNGFRSRNHHIHKEYNDVDNYLLCNKYAKDVKQFLQLFK